MGAPLLQGPIGLVFDDRGVAAHLVVAQPLHDHAQLLPQAVAGRVEDHPFAEDGGHQLVRFAAAQLIVGGAKECLVGLRAGHEDHSGAQQIELDDFAAFAAGPHQQGKRIDDPFRHVADERQPARQKRRCRRRPLRSASETLHARGDQLGDRDHKLGWALPQGR